LYSMERVILPDKMTRIERGGMSPKEERYLPDVGRRRGSAAHFSTSTGIRVVGVGGTVERLHAPHPASRARAPEEVHRPRHRGVVLLVREKPHAKDRVMMCRLGSRSAALQRRWISSGRHSWLTRAPQTWDSKTPRQGRVQLEWTEVLRAVEDLHAAGYKEEHQLSSLEHA
jgi:hypothetical protein